MDNFLKSELDLRLHPNKKHLNRADTGIDFTGFVIKPVRTYLRQTSLSGCKCRDTRLGAPGIAGR